MRADDRQLMHVNLQTEEQALDWLKGYENLYLITLQVSKTFPSKGNGAKNLFKVNVLDYCSHSCHILGYSAYSQIIFRQDNLIKKNDM